VLAEQFTRRACRRRPANTPSGTARLLNRSPASVPSPLGQSMTKWNPESIGTEVAQRVASLIHTSGTTGLPKSVMLTHRNLLFVAAMSARIRCLSSDDRLYGFLPMSHAVGLSVVLLFPAPRIISSCAAPLQPTVKSRVESLFDMPLHNGYGVTECSHKRFSGQSMTVPGRYFRGPSPSGGGSPTGRIRSPSGCRGGAANCGSVAPTS
jgi:long-subunit acyl-CoA synthetase (AMP-forming)